MTLWVEESQSGWFVGLCQFVEQTTSPGFDCLPWNVVHVLLINVKCRYLCGSQFTELCALVHIHGLRGYLITRLNIQHVFQVWSGALLLCDYILHRYEGFQNKHVVDLGAGVGLTSVVAAMFARSVYCTGTSSYTAFTYNVFVINYILVLNFRTTEMECKLSDREILHINPWQITCRQAI